MSKDYVKEWSKVIKGTPPIIKNAVNEYDDEVSSLANSYGALIKENVILRQQIENMRNCINCEWQHESFDPGYYTNQHYPKCLECVDKNDWQMKGAESGE